VRYSAGALVLAGDDPRQVLGRTPAPVLEPETPAERVGVVPQVVFPTGVDVRRGDLLDIYYGMADSRIGLARASVAGLLAAAGAA
jgi:predicted GH43/DUF377 family glycosyl hydrolase